MSSKLRGSGLSVGKKTASQISAKSSKLGSTFGTIAPITKIGLQKPKRGLEWTLPPFSICQKSKKDINWDELQRKLIRRQAPEGENIKEIRLVLKELKDKSIPVHDFINLVSPYTSDNGSELRTILVADMQTFQKMCRKIYQTMTQDVSDVLINEQMLTVEFYQERHDISTEKMMRAINEIYDMAPTFDFEKYYMRKQEYLSYLMPVPLGTSLDTDADTDDMSKRQQLYHRLQWLRNEGERMMDENNRLEQRLNSLKEQQQREQKLAAEAAQAIEAKAVQLEKEENKMRDTLQQLNIDVEKSIIANEAQTIQVFNESNILPVHREQAQKRKERKSRKRPEWASIVAEEIDTEYVREVIATDKEAIPFEPSLRKIKMDSTLTESRVNVTPRNRSNVSFNPDFNSTQIPQSSQEVVQNTSIEHSNVVCQKQRSVARGRQNLAPHDTWEGFR